jgi:glycosyltransferase involved in cell wall biosynthesis
MSSKTRTNFRKKKIVWIVFLMLDTDLHKTSRIEILRHLANRGHETFLFALYSKERYHSKMTDIHVISFPLRYIRYVSSLIYTLLLFLYLPFFLIHLKPDYIIVEPSEPTFLGLISMLLFPRSKRPKIILDVRSTPVSNEYTESLFFNTAICVAKKLFDGITIITRMMKKEICDKYHIDPKSVGVWADGASTTLFNPENYDGIAMRKKFGLDHKFVIFYHGAFGIHRGIAESIKSIEILKSRYPDLMLFLLGGSHDFPEIKKMIQKCGVQDMVIAHDKVNYEDVPKYIALCDVGLVPLPDSPIWRHQCPLKLLEYLAMGKVVIATDIPANREIIGKSKCGIYISSADPREIAKAIMYAHDNKEKLKELGSYGRAIIKEKYNWEKVAEDFENYLLGR